MSCMIMGVHLDEPASSAAGGRWSGHVTSPVKPRQWTDQDLDAFVRQLSNPQHHHVAKRPVSSSGTVSSHRHLQSVIESPSCGRKDSFELCQDLKHIDPTRAPLARSETDTSVAAKAKASNSPNLSQSGVDISTKSSPSGSRSIGGSILSGVSGLRLISNKKIARSSHANAKRNAAAASAVKGKSDEDLSASRRHTSSTSSIGYEDSHTSGVSLSGDGSSPEASDVEASASSLATCNSSYAHDDTTIHSKDSAVIVSKKRRFRKMLTRPLNRSQSAGCAKDVPAHAFFLKKQQKKSKDDEVEARKNRASEGDIRRPRLPSDEIEDDDDSATLTTPTPATTHSSGGIKLLSRIHKTKSADSAMAVCDEFGATVAPPQKTKTRNIAKKISKKMQFLRRRHTDSTLSDMEKDEGARRLATIDPEEAQEWSKSFNTLLYDKTGLELFRGFLQSEHSEENIEFWVACENYKHSKSSKQLPSLAQKIFNDYVAVQSRREVNLDSKTRNMTYESVTSNPTRQTFDEAQRRVQALMEKDSYRRFLESEIYVDLAAGNLYHKS